jgi:DnaJ-class molecular chaperone
LRATTQLDGGCGEPLFYGGRDAAYAARVRSSANRPGGNPELPHERDVSRLEAVFSGAATADVRAVRPVRPLGAGRAGCAPCGCTGFAPCPTCGCSGVYIEPCTQSAGVTNLVPCVSCGGSGDTLCDACAGRGTVAA